MGKYLATTEKIVDRSSKRVGRGYGSGKGKTSGRGQTGQRARSHVPVGFEGGQTKMSVRLPYMRGRKFNNHRVRPDSLTLTLLAAKFKPEEEITLTALKTKGLVGRRTRKVKILGTGALQSKLHFKDVFMFTATAREKINKAGGHITEAPKTEEKAEPVEEQKA